MARVGAQILVRWPCNGGEFFMKLIQRDVYVTGPDSHSVVADAKEERLRASEKIKGILILG